MSDRPCTGLIDADQVLFPDSTMLERKGDETS